MKIEITIPKALWLSANRPIKNRGYLQRIRNDLHDLAILAARGIKPIPEPVEITWTIHYPKGTGWTHGDPSNAHPTCKAILDGIVSAGVLPGDGPLIVTSETWRRGENLGWGGDHVVGMAASGPLLG